MSTFPIFLFRIVFYFSSNFFEPAKIVVLIENKICLN